MKLKQHPLIISFLLPIIITTIYFAFRGMAPFGQSSILTVDLGQQYIDFFAYFKHTLLTDPSSFLYSFSKGLGGDMLGTWAYYLMSPLNLILLFCSTSQLPSGILILTVLKYGLSGLTFAYLLKANKVNTAYIPVFAISYSLMGWVIANQLNIIWLDAVIILPLIYLGLQRLILQQRVGTYITWLAIMLIVNYYLAFMIAIFTVLTSWFININFSNSRRQFWQNQWRWLWSSLVAGGISAVITLPTFYSLLTSKINYSENKINWKIEYLPLKFFGKFFTGSLDFKQLPSGTPNIFVASLVLILFNYFYFSKQFNRKLRLTHGLITLILFVSMWFEPLDLFWHAMQMPVWYTYRFAFIFSFWLVLTAAKVFTTVLSDELSLNALKKALIISFITIFVVGILLPKLEYLTLTNYIWGIIYFSLTAALIILVQKFKLWQVNYLPGLLLLLVGAEMAFNLVNSLNNLAYLSKDEYTVPASIIQQQAARLPQKPNNFYRVASTFMRTKNDALTGSYNGTSVFSSTLESTSSKFYGNLGAPDGDSFIAYTNGTTFSDTLLGIKYYWSANAVQNPLTGKPANSPLETQTTRPDLNSYPIMNKDQYVSTHVNSNALPIAFLANATDFNYQTTNSPIAFQNQLFTQITNQSQSLIVPTKLPTLNYQNLYPVNKLTNSVLRKRQLLNPASFNFTLKAKKGHSYYLTLGSDVSSKEVAIYVNGKKIKQYSNYRHTVIANLANVKKNENVAVLFVVKKNNAWLQNVNLYQLNNKRLNTALKETKTRSLKLTHVSNTNVTGNITINKNRQDLLTTIPASKGWHVKVDDHPIKTQTWGQMFLKVPLSRGHHRIQITYWPQGLTAGIIISCCSLLLLVIILIKKRPKQTLI
ncbi:YfhO family protein [Lentilactobacillus senioris]|uniref:YfhO family protein n=1 Tax=Lentilactobacillus senioris TaxID=931534 RepID=UPI002282DB9A|nr:YfhO family protein [Lentilactobacillus senioris]MCY9806931.1 YfhO family protein [Lentilactobacillus senioris]